MHVGGGLRSTAIVGELPAPRQKAQREPHAAAGRWPIIRGVLERDAGVEPARSWPRASAGVRANASRAPAIA